MMFGSILSILSLTVIMLSVSESQFLRNAETLAQYNIDPYDVTVSGISSGGGMATQFHFAYSNQVKGAGIFAGVPYLCAYKSLLSATACALSPSLIDIGNLMEKTAVLAEKQSIDPTANINGSRVYIWQGKWDTVVKSATGGKLKDMYELYGAQVATEFSYNAAHGQPTDNFGGPCGVLSPLTQFINNCNYKGAFEMFKKVYGDDLNPPSTTTGLVDNLVKFNQREFYNPLWINGMANNGFIYVPTGCRDGVNKCRFHIAFHGCMSNIYYVGNNYAEKTGYIEAAEANNIIILFPQADLTNPMGCWDWFGYLGFIDYPTKDGPQMESVYKMLQRVAFGV